LNIVTYFESLVSEQQFVPSFIQLSQSTKTTIQE